MKNFEEYFFEETTPTTVDQLYSEIGKVITKAKANSLAMYGHKKRVTYTILFGFSINIFHDLVRAAVKLIPKETQEAINKTLKSSYYRRRAFEMPSMLTSIQAYHVLEILYRNHNVNMKANLDFVAGL